MNTFYYNIKKLYLLTAFNTILLFTVVFFGQYIPQSLWWCSIVAVLCLISLSASAFVTIFPQRLALINEAGIVIDHNKLLKWEDIETAKKIKTSYLSAREVITFNLKEGVSYSLSFMQKICEKSPYGAFSIPLYAMTKEDKEKIEQEIKKYIKIN